MKQFSDRQDAGRRLAEKLTGYIDAEPVVIALPRGGVPVAREVAIALGAPLDIFAVRKLGAPQNPEYGFGAVAEDGSRLLNDEAVLYIGIDAETIASILAREVEEIKRQVSIYRGGRPPLELRNRTVIAVDDGVATGITDATALAGLRNQGPGRLVMAVPVCPPESLALLEGYADEVIALPTPSDTHGISQRYRDFSQVSDEQVIAILEELRENGTQSP